MHIYRCVSPSGAQSLRKSTEAILIKDMDKKRKWQRSGAKSEHPTRSGRKGQESSSYISEILTLGLKLLPNLLTAQTQMTPVLVSASQRFLSYSNHETVVFDSYLKSHFKQCLFGFSFAGKKESSKLLDCLKKPGGCGGESDQLPTMKS